MPADPRTYLWEARQAAVLVVQFVEGRTWDDYSKDRMLRSAVERQFEIVGEALNKLRRTDETLAAQIPDLPGIVVFRNLLIHGYATVDDRLGGVASNRAAPLASVLEDMLESGS